MKKILLSLLLVAAIVSCDKAQDPYEWSKSRVGHLTKDTQVHQLDSIFAQDSLINPIKGDEFSNGAGFIEVYEKGGKHLLSISPKEALDSTSTIENILIRDARYTTKEGINIASNYGQISKVYSVSSVDNMIDQAVIWVNEENFYFTVDKELLPEGVRFDMMAKIEKTMIPDDATPTHVFVAW